MANGKGTNPIPSSRDPSHRPPLPPSPAFKIQKGWRATAATTRTAQWHRRASDGRPCVAQPAADGTAGRPAPPPPRPPTLRRRPPRIGPPRGHRHRDAREAYRARSLPPPPSPEALGKGPHMTCMPVYHTIPYYTLSETTAAPASSDGGGGRWRGCVWRARAPSAAASPSFPPPPTPGKTDVTSAPRWERVRWARRGGRGRAADEIGSRPRQRVPLHHRHPPAPGLLLPGAPLPPRLLRVSVRRWPAAGSGRDGLGYWQQRAGGRGAWPCGGRGSGGRGRKVTAGGGRGEGPRPRRRPAARF